MKNPTMTLRSLPAVEVFDFTTEPCPVDLAMDEADGETLQ